MQQGQCSNGCIFCLISSAVAYYPLIFDLEQFGVFQSRVSDDEDVEVCSVLSLVQGQYGHSKQEGGTAKAAGDLKSS